MSTVLLSEIEKMRPKLKGRRLEALDAFLKAGIPTSKTENWRFSPASKLRAPVHLLGNSKFSECASLLEPTLLGWKKLLPDFSRVIVLDGIYRKDLSDIDIETSPEATGTTPAGALSRLNFALHSEALKIRPERPIHLAFISTQDSLAVFPNIHWEIGAGRSCEIIQTFDDWSRSGSLHHIQQRFNLQAGTLLHLSKVESARSHSLWLQHSEFDLDAQSGLDMVSVVLGGSLSRSESMIRLNGPQARAHISAVLGGTQTECIDQQVRIEHRVPETSSFQFFKGAMAGRAHGIFQGRIVVSKDAQKTDAHQSSRAMLLSDEARFTALPELEIDADDVRCSHGTAIGGLDPAALFYLRSRGISAIDAQQLLLEGYASEILNSCSQRTRGVLQDFWKKWVDHAAI